MKKTTWHLSLTLLCWFVVTVIFWTGILLVQNSTIVINTIVSIPKNLFFYFFAGAICLKTSQLLVRCFTRKKVAKKKQLRSQPKDNYDISDKIYHDLEKKREARQKKIAG